MSLGDIPGYERYDFCRFDPTAAGGVGLDVEMFQASMGCLNAVFRTFQFQTLLHSKDTAKSDLGLYVPP
jgi:hypothetical protein